MKTTRIKAARFIWNQSKRSGVLKEEDIFNPDDVDLKDIKDNNIYYAVFEFIPNIANHSCLHGDLLLPPMQLIVMVLVLNLLGQLSKS